MPYKDPRKKTEWEWRHHSQRLARRRELRRIEAARKAAEPATARVELGEGLLWFLLIASGILAFVILNPRWAKRADIARGSPSRKDPGL
jgi:hypothetical protein